MQAGLVSCCNTEALNHTTQEAQEASAKCQGGSCPLPPKKSQLVGQSKKQSKAATSQWKHAVLKLLKASTPVITTTGTKPGRCHAVLKPQLKQKAQREPKTQQTLKFKPPQHFVSQSGPDKCNHCLCIVHRACGIVHSAYCIVLAAAIANSTTTA
jgi:hypothetical protein